MRKHLKERDGFTERVVFQRVEELRWVAYYAKPNRSYALVIEPSDQVLGKYMATVIRDSDRAEWVAEPNYLTPRTAAVGVLRIMDRWDEEMELESKTSNIVPIRESGAA